MAKNGVYFGNNFLVRDGDFYVAYAAISDVKNRERTLAAIVQDKVRGQKYGKILLSGISEFLLNNKYALSLKLHIAKTNLSSIHLAESCGYMYDIDDKNGSCSFYRRD